MFDVSTPWHARSFDRFIHERLPALLAERLPLVDYRVELETTYSCMVETTFASAGMRIPLRYAALPRPDADGVFMVDGRARVVLPIATDERLDTAEIRCAGEQLYDAIAAQLGSVPRGMPLTEELLRAWLPLDRWLREFFGQQRPGTQMPQGLDEGNWLARQEHLRRLYIDKHHATFNTSQVGRVCPFETPEGPNIARYVHLALGATIRAGRLVVVEEQPAAALGLAAALVPFLEHDDPMQLLMGTNMQRQWMTPPRYWAHPAGGESRLVEADGPAPEPALVQTGLEPDGAPIWAGHNLLTAFVAWGEDTFEDGIVLSESAARRLGYPKPIEPGDKLSNRHGAKGVVSRILPDAAMPHLPDGTAVELVFHALGVISRMSFGQIREALMSRIARAEGRPAIVPPFGAPTDGELRERMRAAGLADDGLQQLTRGRDGAALERPSMAGWVYWGRVFHQASDKLIAWTDGTTGQAVGEAEYAALRAAGAFETIREHFTTAAVRSTGTELSPQFAALVERLAAAGIRAELADDSLRFGFADPAGDTLQLAEPVPHPWLRERTITEIGAQPELPGWEALVTANERLERMRAGAAPPSLRQRARDDLAQRVRQLFAAILTPAHLRFASRVTWTGRAVIAPGPELSYDQVGVPEELAWALWGPRLAPEHRTAGHQPDEAALAALDTFMAGEWVVLYRAFSLSPTPFVAYRPVRVAGRALRVHPGACALLDADFDGDQVALFAPLTPESRREAGERLSAAAHLRRDPGLTAAVHPRIEALWGLAALSLTPAGRAEIDTLAGTPVAAPSGYVDKQALAAALRTLVEQRSAEQALEALDRLRRRGWEIATASGLSLGPFFGATLPDLPAPTDDDPDSWGAYLAERSEQLVAHHDWLDGDLGPFLLAARSGARSNLRQIMAYLGPRGIIAGVDGTATPIRHGYRAGLEPAEQFALAAAMRENLAGINRDLQAAADPRPAPGAAAGGHVLARARRSDHPGAVFARAAASGETDPLADPDTRLFVGLPPHAS